MIEVSKFLQSQILVDGDEMADLFTCLDPFMIYRTGALTKRGEGLIPHQEFLNAYRNYVTSLQGGLQPDESVSRPYFSSVFTVFADCLDMILMENDQQLIRPSRPVIQLQPHRIGWSPADGKFRPMVLGLDSISWGIQFSYPQLFCDPKTKEVVKIDTGARFPNTALFQKLQRWVRDATMPTPFLVGGVKINVPMRIGKKCLGWINNHPQLIQKGIRV